MDTILNFAGQYPIFDTVLAVWGVITTSAAGLAKIFPKAKKLGKIVHYLALNPTTAKS